MNELSVKAVWANGLTDDNIEMDRILELKEGNLYAKLFGYAAIIVDTRTDPPSVEAIHPEVEGIGFQVVKTSDFGFPLKIRVRLRFLESDYPTEIFVDHFPIETIPLKIGDDAQGNAIVKEYHVRQKPLSTGGRGFFMLRNQKGLKGIRGLPEYIQLVHPVRQQSDILNAYTPFAKKQGMGFPTIYLDTNTPANRASVKAQWAKMPQTNRLLMLSNLDLVEYIQPLANAYDPFPILQWIDALIARKTQMNKLMLEGDPAGYLSASETAINNWEKEVMEQQAFWKSQFQPIWKAMGAKEDCSFQTPTKPTFISLMEGIAKGREGLEGLITNESLVAIISEYLKGQGIDWKLEVISNEELAKKQGGMNPNGGTGQPGQNKGNKTN